jgi:hypothetical protein
MLFLRLTCSRSNNEPALVERQYSSDYAGYSSVDLGGAYSSIVNSGAYSSILGNYNELYSSILANGAYSSILGNVYSSIIANHPQLYSSLLAEYGTDSPRPTFGGGNAPSSVLANPTASRGGNGVFGGNGNDNQPTGNGGSNGNGNGFMAAAGGDASTDGAALSSALCMSSLLIVGGMTGFLAYAL